MATIRLIPSTYYLSSSSYLSVSDASNMYSNTDSTTYGTVTHNRASTSKVYYAYLRGFNFNDVPSNATVTGFTIKLKASATGHTTSTSTSYYMSLYNDTTAIESTTASGRLTTTTTTFTFSNGSMTWEDLKGYGSDFGIRIPLRRASTNTADVVSVYGAEIEVTYTEQQQSVIYVKENGNWQQYSKVYKKTNGTWVEQTDLSNVFDANKKYVKLSGETLENLYYQDEPYTHTSTSSGYTLTFDTDATFYITSTAELARDVQRASNEFTLNLIAGVTYRLTAKYLSGSVQNTTESTTACTLSLYNTNPREKIVDVKVSGSDTVSAEFTATETISMTATMEAYLYTGIKYTDMKYELELVDIS